MLEARTVSLGSAFLGLGVRFTAPKYAVIYKPKHELLVYKDPNAGPLETKFKAKNSGFGLQSSDHRMKGCRVVGFRVS